MKMRIVESEWCQQLNYHRSIGVGYWKISSEIHWHGMSLSKAISSWLSLDVNRPKVTNWNEVEFAFDPTVLMYHFNVIFFTFQTEKGVPDGKAFDSHENFEHQIESRMRKLNWSNDPADSAKIAKQLEALITPRIDRKIRKGKISFYFPTEILLSKKISPLKQILKKFCSLFTLSLRFWHQEVSKARNVTENCPDKFKMVKALTYCSIRVLKMASILGWV